MKSGERKKRSWEMGVVNVYLRHVLDNNCQIFVVYERKHRKMCCDRLWVPKTKFKIYDFSACRAGRKEVVAQGREKVLENVESSEELEILWWRTAANVCQCLYEESNCEKDHIVEEELLSLRRRCLRPVFLLPEIVLRRLSYFAHFVPRQVL